MGTGTGDIIRLSREAGLPKEPIFIQEEEFKTIIWRKEKENIEQTDNDLELEDIENENFDDDIAEQTNEDSDSINEVPNEEEMEAIRRVVMVLRGEFQRSEIQNLLQLRHRDNFRVNYLNPALKYGYIEMIYPDNPNHSQQRYRLTEKGIKLKRKKKK